MVRKLEYFEEALEEAVAAARWYAERSATAAAAFSDEIDEAESAIARLPDAWPRFDYGTRRYLLRRFPFSIVYRVEANRIVIVAVAHSRRRPGYWSRDWIRASSSSRAILARSNADRRLTND